MYFLFLYVYTYKLPCMYIYTYICRLGFHFILILIELFYMWVTEYTVSKRFVLSVQSWPCLIHFQSLPTMHKTSPLTFLCYKCLIKIDIFFLNFWDWELWLYTLIYISATGRTLVQLKMQTNNIWPESLC